jgi:hypothetical protein
VNVREGESQDEEDGGSTDEGDLHGSREYVSATPEKHEGSGQMYFRWMKRQKGFIRFNCADSLDRTNVATFCTLCSWPLAFMPCV